MKQLSHDNTACSQYTVHYIGSVHGYLMVTMRCLAYALCCRYIPCNAAQGLTDMCKTDDGFSQLLIIQAMLTGHCSLVCEGERPYPIPLLQAHSCAERFTGRELQDTDGGVYLG